MRPKQPIAHPTLSRRQALAWATASLIPMASHAVTAKLPAPAEHAPLAALEQRVGGRLGVALLDCASGAMVGHRLQERFGMCSTFKLPLAAVVLKMAEQGRLRLDQWVPYTQADMIAHAPVTSKHLASAGGKGGMTVGALAEATQRTSDNPAANLLLALLGGPAGLTAELRALGDAVTRTDRYEPAANFVPPGEVRDTTTPAAMCTTLQTMLTTPWLGRASQEMLIGWMVATATGSQRLRAGLPAGWRAGDKTGTGMSPGMMDKYNDLAIVWPDKAKTTGVPQAAPRKGPLIISAFYETPVAHGGDMRDEDQAVLAEVGRIATAWVLKRA